MIASGFSQYKVESESRPGCYYVVTEDNGAWQCACIGWTRHVPRRDCKHISWVKRFGGVPVEPMLMAMERAQAKAKRKVGVP